MKQPGDQQADRDIFNIDNKGTVTVINQPVPQRSRSEFLLLDAVKKEVISRLSQSLHNAVFINLGKQAQPQQVKCPWDAKVKIGSKPPEALPAETTILEVFDHPSILGRLLILGEPGAGKTTTMLDLAKALCDRANKTRLLQSQYC
jgi:predicted NACHT family NTPase